MLSHPYSAPQVDVFAKKRYKPVAQKVRPVLGSLPEQFRIVREITGDPLAALPSLNPVPPPFAPTGRYTQDRCDVIDRLHPEGFLWPEERRLMHHFMLVHQDGFAWTDLERGKFRSDFFKPIPPGIYDQVCELIRKKIAAGVYEPSNSSYRSRWFCVVKKDGASLRLVHSLEPLNAVTIQHSGVPPLTDQLAEQFAGRACGGILDLTFQTPFGAQRLTTLPMGWSNSVPIFHDDVTVILQPEIPEFTIPYIDDVPARGPESRYPLADGSPETIYENPGIRRFVWEHFSGPKAILCAEQITVLGHVCTPAGRIPDPDRVAKIENWGPCQNLSDVRAFLGTGKMPPLSLGQSRSQLKLI